MDRVFRKPSGLFLTCSALMLRFKKVYREKRLEHIVWKIICKVDDVTYESALSHSCSVCGLFKWYNNDSFYLYVGTVKYYDFTYWTHRFIWFVTVECIRLLYNILIFVTKLVSFHFVNFEFKHQLFRIKLWV